VRLPDTRIEVVDESGLDLSQVPATTYGDPVVRRRDGAVAYHLASVVDDEVEGVSRVVRGRDLAPSTPVQRALAELLGFGGLDYRHHLLLLERRERKWAKFHQAVGTDVLRVGYDAPALCGLLAYACELIPEPAPTMPGDLLTGFRWSSVRQADRRLDWDGEQLRFPES
jgi:glutamyl/glutaminyl-tRNA synthetase